MIEFKDVAFQYEQGSSKGKIENINLTIHDGEVVLICGESGCGKTTLTRLINGLIPHYYEGTLTGQTIVEGIDVKNVSLYALSGVVGSVFQNPRTQFFTVDTTSEIAFGCENLAIDADEINLRIEKTVGALKIEDLLNRSLFALSGGEKQKIACASVSAMEPDIFVLDEPSSNLDIKSSQRIKTCYMVMQDVNHQLFTESVMDEILLSLDNSDEEKAAHEAESIMESLHISEFRDAHPMSLSGGQKQRVAIASAIASDKQVIVFDEPTSGLDYRHMKKVAENLRELSSLRKTLFIVTHDPELIAECCNYFVFIENGKVLWSDGWNRISRERLQKFFAFEDDLR